MKAKAQRFCLKIGWFEIQVNCHRVPEWLDPIENRYGKFLTSETSNNFSLQLSVLPPNNSSDYAANKLPGFTRDGVFFSKPGWEGELDFSRKSGWVRPGSSFFIEEIDYFLRTACAIQAFYSGGLLFHAAGVVREENGYIFLGRSGAGKTTIARLSGEKNILNDDLVLLLPTSSSWMVYSTPFFNPTQIMPRENLCTPLKRMFSLIQDQWVYLEDASPGQALAEIIASVPVISAHSELADDLMSRCQKLVNDIPFNRLHFQKNDSFWEVIEKSKQSPPTK